MSLHIQPRDLAILTDLGEYGLLDTQMLQHRHWGKAETMRACQHRMRLLTQEALVKKANLIVAFDASSKSVNGQGGSIPTAYVLTPKGAEVLEKLTETSPRRVSRSSPAATTLLHRLEMVETRLVIDNACLSHKLTTPEWIMEYDTYPKVRLEDPIEKRHILYERFQTAEGEFYSRPDASCSIGIPRPKQPEAKDELIVYWELDRGTNSPTRERNKSGGYDALIRGKAYRNHWPSLGSEPAAVRIFYVCPSQERIDSIVGELRSLTVAKAYRFITRLELRNAQILTDMVWQDIERKRYAIMRTA